MKLLKKGISFVCCRFYEKLFAAWFFASAILISTTVEEIALGNINIPLFLCLSLSSFILMNIAQYRFRDSVNTLLVASVLFFAMMLLVVSNNIYTYLATGIIFVLAVKHFFDNKDEITMRLTKRNSKLMLMMIVLFFFTILTAMALFRYFTYSTPNYDFGIFCNMYYNMRESFSPIVSCERDKLLSHFAVHLSPAMYVFLPLYYIFPSPATVALCQSLAVYSGIIPFILIMKNRKLDSLTICLLSVVYSANAAYTAGCLFDFHENCLLVPFLMWMFYFYEKKKLPLMFLFALFTLMVKEDAFIYVSVFAVYIIVSERSFFKGASLLFLAVAYFAFACYVINQYGTGIMSDRYDIMIEGEEGLFGIIKTVLANAGYSVSQIFGTEEKEPAKLIYFLQLMCPLAFIPFFTRVHTRWILVLPVLLNLLTDYGYQYDITFQYSFGIMSLLLYLCVINISDMDKRRRDYTSVLAAGLAVMMFFMLIMPRFTNESSDYLKNKEMYQKMDEVIEQIPEDARVAATTFLIPQLSERREIYEVYYTTQTDFDYVIFDMRSAYRETSLKYAQIYEEKGYELLDIGNEYIYVYAEK